MPNNSGDPAPDLRGDICVWGEHSEEILHFKEDFLLMVLSGSNPVPVIMTTRDVGL